MISLWNSKPLSAVRIWKRPESPMMAKMALATDLDILSVSGRSQMKRECTSMTRRMWLKPIWMWESPSSDRCRSGGEVKMRGVIVAGGTRVCGCCVYGMGDNVGQGRSHPCAWLATTGGLPGVDRQCNRLRCGPWHGMSRVFRSWTTWKP